MFSAYQDHFSEPKHIVKFSECDIVNLSGAPELFKAYQFLWV